jgi:hypothetical protein
MCHRNSRQRSENDQRILKAYEKNAEMKKENVEKARENAEMAKQLRQMADKLHKAELQNQELSATIQWSRNDSRGRITALETDLQAGQAQFNAAIGELERIKRHYAGLEESNRRQSEQLHVIKEELRRAEAQHAQTRHLLEERTMELKGAQRFLTQTDSLSGAEVISMAESLNAEILQAAAYMADSLEFSYRQITNVRAYEESCERGRGVLGRPIMQVLRSRRGQNEMDLDPTPVQIALQITMVYCSAKIAELWTPGKGKENDILVDIFSRISEKGICSKN